MGCVLVLAQVSLSGEHYGGDHSFSLALMDGFKQILYLVILEERGWRGEEGGCRNSMLNNSNEELPAAEDPHAVILLQVRK